MNLDIQPNHVTVIINAASIKDAIRQLMRAKVALQTMIVPAPLSEEELHILLGALTDHWPQASIGDIPAEEPEQIGVMAESTVKLESSPEEAVAVEKPAEPEPEPEEETEAEALPPLAELQADYNKAGQDLFGNDWAQASPWLVKRYTTKFTTDHVRDRLSKLTAAEVADLITRLVENAAAFQTAWTEHKQAAQQPTQSQDKTKRRSPRRSTQTPDAPTVDGGHPANVVYATG